MTTPAPDPRTAALELVQALIAADKEGIDMKLGAFVQNGANQGTWRIRADKLQEWED